jgi:LmbE family N-acetylglucosaminyl deacetylase
VIFAPHPDDEIFGCFGAIMSHLDRHENIQVVYLTSGEAGDSSVTSAVLKETRENEAKKVMSSLGIGELLFLGFPDGRLENDLSTQKVVAKVLAESDPFYVYAPNEKEPHRDHKSACRIVAETLQSLVSDDKYFEIRYYEVWGSLSRFNLVIDISSLVENKRKLIRMFESQLKNVRYDEQILTINNKYRGNAFRQGSFCEVYDCYRVSSKGNERMRLRTEEIKSCV